MFSLPFNVTFINIQYPTSSIPMLFNLAPPPQPYHCTSKGCMQVVQNGHGRNPSRWLLCCSFEGSQITSKGSTLVADAILKITSALMRVCAVIWRVCWCLVSIACRYVSSRSAGLLSLPLTASVDSILAEISRNLIPVYNKERLLSKAGL